MKSLPAAAMKKDLLDLFNAVFIKLPPLRERKEDIPLLINHFLYTDSPAAKTRIYGITPSAMNILLRYHWPGNLIQLQNVIERAFAMGVENAIGPEDLPAEIRTFRYHLPNGLRPWSVFHPTPLWLTFS